jgi:MtN3 and saliva related transmembrane protein
MIKYYEIIGYIGVFFISINLVPQIYHIYKIKNSDAISYMFIIIGFFSSFFMGLYGILVEKNPIIISNTITFCFYCILLITKFYFKNHKEENTISNIA